MNSRKQNKKVGRVYLVGGGPGDPGLLTLKGKALLEEADVILYDYLANPELLKWCKPSALQIYVGKKGNYQQASQNHIEGLLIKNARKGKIVVRLKGGDPFVFGRGGEEAEALHQAGIPFEIVPGVTSAIAVPAYAGIPVTHRTLSSTVAFITGHEAKTSDRNTQGKTAIPWGSLKDVETLVFLMGTANLSENMARLQEAGRDPRTPAAIISWGTYGKQRTITGVVSNISLKAKEAAIKPPAIVVVGDVVRLREELNWFESKPLFGQQILLTRSTAQSSRLSDQLTALGAEVLSLPTIEINEPSSYQKMDKALAHLEKYQWLLFTSVNGVEAFLKRYHISHSDGRALSHLKIAAIGPSTAQKLKEAGLWVDLMPQIYDAEGLAEAFKKRKIKNCSILFPRAREGREVILKSLEKSGNQVDLVEAYRTKTLQKIDSHLKSKILQSPPDWIIFTSSSTVRGFMNILGKQVNKVTAKAKIACFGPVTRKTALSYGLKVRLTPAESTTDSLVKAFLQKK